MPRAGDATGRASQPAPPLKWAGGKRWLAPALARLYAPHRSRRLVDPFVGGLAVPLCLRPERALLADANPHLVAFYRWLARGPSVPGAMRNEASAYYGARERFNALVGAGQGHTAEAAALFYYLNRTGYNGLCRFNRAGRFNVPFGSHRAITYQTDFAAYAGAMTGWELRCSDFETLPLHAADFVYADPPYDVEFTQYAGAGFAWEDQVRLAHWLARHPGPVVASNQATPRILELYKSLGFHTLTLAGPRRIACNGDRAPALEVLATRGVPREAVNDALLEPGIAAGRAL